MKLIKYSFGMLVLVLVTITSCTDFVEPRIPYSSFDTGAYLRTVERTSTSFNFFDLQSSTFAITVDAVDSENGATVESVEVRVRKRRLIPGVGLEFVPAAGAEDQVNDVLITTLTASDFAPNPESKFLRATIEVTAPETLTALGINASQVEGGDIFEFRLTLRDKSGRVFNDVNASADIKGGLFYASPFLYNVAVVCPTDLGGTYTYSTLVTNSPYARACEGQTLTGSVTLTPIPNTSGYTISDGSFGMFDCSDTGWGNGNLRLNDACGGLTFSGSDKYGSAYTLTFVSNDGKNLVFDWVTTDNEASRTTLIAPDDKPWPEGLR